MKKILFIIALAFISMNVNAHNPNTASVYISPINGVWVAQFTISQEGANYALNTYYSERDLSSLTTTEYKELYIDYVKNKVVLLVDDQIIELSSGGIKLGNHQTDIKFLMPNFPKNYKSVQLKLAVFEENIAQNIVVKFVDQDSSFRKVLNHSNQFEMNFEKSEKGFIDTNDHKKKYSKIIYVLLILFICGIGFYVISKKQRKNVSKNV